MALSDNKRFYDISTRIQVYVEGVKITQAAQFNTTLFELREELKRLLLRVNHQNLDGLTKAQLNKLIIAIRKSQSVIYSKYTEQVLKQLRDFMDVDLEVSRIVYGTAVAQKELGDDIVKQPISDREAIELIRDRVEDKGLIPLFGLLAVTGSNDALWSKIINAPISANGAYLLPFLQAFSISAQMAVENAVRKAWVNGLSVQGTISELTGTTRQGNKSQLQRIENQARVVSNTAMQHVGAIVSAGVTSALFGYYTWHSVIDSATSDICRERNLKRWRYGNGPLPPAHMNCRSHVAPSVGTDTIAAETFYQWTLRQPIPIQKDVLNGHVASDFDSQQFKEYDNEKPVSLSQFRNKISNILLN